MKSQVDVSKQKYWVYLLKSVGSESLSSPVVLVVASLGREISILREGVDPEAQLTSDDVMLSPSTKSLRLI